MKEKYFAASNSGKGFKNYFGDIFTPDRLRHIYIIKGGPGTGKSYFMRCVADEAEKRDKKVIRYFCSSDQNSLDGIIIDGEIGFLDGTAPHTYEAKIPGAVENIIDLGAYWDINKLTENIAEIESLNREKASHYARAYNYLSAYYDIGKGVERLTVPFLKRDKMDKYVSKALEGIKNGEFYSEETVVCGSVGMEGLVRFSSLEEAADKIFLLSDYKYLSHHFLSAVLGAAKEKKLSVVLSHDVIDSERLDAVYLKDSRILFTSCGEGMEEKTKKLSMSRFVSADGLISYKASLKNSEKLKEMILAEALAALSDVKKAHFKLEEIYKGTMDFEAKEKFTAKFMKKLFQ